MQTTTRKAYATDLTDEQWAILESLIPQAKHGGRPREVDMREVINTILYLNRTGCQWDMLPHDLPAKRSMGDCRNGGRKRRAAPDRAQAEVGRGCQKECHAGKRRAGIYGRCTPPSANGFN